MNAFLTVLTGLGLPLALITLLFGPVVAAKRMSRRSDHRKPVHTGSAPVAESTDRSAGPVGVDVQLTTVLAQSGQVLLGYRTREASAAGRRSTDAGPLATRTLLLSLGEGADAVVSTLDRWSEEGIELALRLSDDNDIVVLCDRRTAQRLVLKGIQAPGG